jgi:hypothetical protein
MPALSIRMGEMAEQVALKPIIPISKTKPLGHILAGKRGTGAPAVLERVNHADEP